MIAMRFERGQLTSVSVHSTVRINRAIMMTLRGKVQTGVSLGST